MKKLLVKYLRYLLRDIVPGKVRPNAFPVGFCSIKCLGSLMFHLKKGSQGPGNSVYQIKGGETNHSVISNLISSQKGQLQRYIACSPCAKRC